MAIFKTVDDRNSEILPTVAELRKSQAQGATGEGLNQSDCTELNATQGHQADIREHTDAAKQAAMIKRNMTEGDPKLTKTLMDDVDRTGWPEGEVL